MSDRKANLIILTRTRAGWMARFVGDDHVVRAFGTDTIPTAYTAACKPEAVIDAISALNPHCRVELGSISSPL